MYMEVRGGHVEVSSLLPLCGSQGPEAIHQLGSKPFSTALVADSLRKKQELQAIIVSKLFGFKHVEKLSI